jgi:hypothetical protein
MTAWAGIVALLWCGDGLRLTLAVQEHVPRLAAQVCTSVTEVADCP